MRRLRGAVAAVYEFVVGDDPAAAVGVVIALGLTAALVAADVPAWWLLPVAVLVLLGITLRNGLCAPAVSRALFLG